MGKSLRLGVIGFAHMHVNTLMEDFAALSDVRWVACADTQPDTPELADVPGCRARNLRYARESIGIPRTYDDYRELLRRESLDLAIVCCENARHGEVGEAVALSGASVLVEKPMASSLDDALRIWRAARATGVGLYVNYPSTWSAAIRQARALVIAGAIGDVREVRWRAGSLGPWSHGSRVALPSGDEREMTAAEKGATWWYRPGTGGGALLDYCSYGACLARWYVGQPAETAIGMAANIASHYGGVDDTALIAVRFPGAIAKLEATWACADHGVAPGPILVGSTGTLVVERWLAPERITIHRGRGLPSEEVAVDALPPGRETLARELLHHLRTGEPLHETLDADFNLQAMAILDAGIRSVRSGHAETVDTATWRLD